MRLYEIMCVKILKIVKHYRIYFFLLNFYFLFLKFILILNFYWSIVDLQCCVSFRCTTVNQLYIYIYPLFFQILFPYRSLQSIEQSSLCYTVGPYLLSVSFIVVCICQSQSSNLFAPSLPTGNLSLFSTSVTLFLFSR